MEYKYIYSEELTTWTIRKELKKKKKTKGNTKNMRVPRGSVSRSLVMLINSSVAISNETSVHDESQNPFELRRKASIYLYR